MDKQLGITLYSNISAQKLPRAAMICLCLTIFSSLASDYTVLNPFRQEKKLYWYIPIWLNRRLQN